MQKTGQADAQKRMQAESGAKALWEDPLMGARSQADAETAQELKEQGNDKFKRKLYEEALEHYNEAVQLQPRDPTLWLNRSIVNRQLQNWGDAEEDAMIASEFLPENPKAHYSLALCKQHAGQLEKALEACKAGLKAQPENKALLQLEITVKRQLAEKRNERPTKGASKPPGETRQATAKPAGQAKAPASQPKRDALEPENDAEAEDDFPSCPVGQLKGGDVDDIKARARNTMYEWKGGNPSNAERDAIKRMLTDSFKQKYAELRAQASSARTTIETSQYDKTQKLGLEIKGGHQPMPRPESVELPDDFKQPMGVIDMDTLKKYSYQNPSRRYLISVYGNVFDVSDRPDKYGPDGPYISLTGADITWGLFAGVDQESYVNRCYDLFKAKDMGKDKIAGVCSWLAWYWTEYGEPVAQLDLYLRERDLPAPPLEEVDDMCAVM